MRYLKHINESLDDKKYFDDLKSLPYPSFVSKLAERVKSDSFQNALNNLDINEDLSEDYGLVKLKELPAHQLIPTQSQIGIIETLSWTESEDVNSMQDIITNNKTYLFDKNRILVANNKWILDGHHKWAYVYMLNPDCTIPCININLPNRKPIDILKDIQICVGATYKTLYNKREKLISVSLEGGDTNSGNISQMSDEAIRETVSQVLDDKVINTLRGIYGSMDFKKFLIKQFVDESWLKTDDKVSESIQSNDFGDTKKLQSKIHQKRREEKKPISQEFKQLMETDKEKESSLEDVIEDKLADTIQNIVDIAGIFDPSPTLNILNCVGYIYRRQWMKAFIQIIAALPIGEIIARPLMGFMKNKIFAKLATKFGSYLTRLEAKGFAKVLKEIEEYEAKKLGSDFFSKMFKVFFENFADVIAMIGKVIEKIAPHYAKFKIFYKICKGLPGFFAKVKGIKEGISDELNNSSESDVFNILASGAIKIKRLIVDRGIDKFNVNFSMGVQPLQTAIQAKTNPFTSEFKGVPILLLNNIPSILKKLSGTESAQIEEEEEEQKLKDKDKSKERKVGDFTDFANKIYPQSQKEKEVVEPKSVETKPIETVQKQVAQAPKVQAPKAQAPKAQAPKAQEPKSEEPIIDKTKKLSTKKQNLKAVG